MHPALAVRQAAVSIARGRLTYSAFAELAAALEVTPPIRRQLTLIARWIVFEPCRPLSQPHSLPAPNSPMFNADFEPKDAEPEDFEPTFKPVYQIALAGNPLPSQRMVDRELIFTPLRMATQLSVFLSSFVPAAAHREPPPSHTRGPRVMSRPARLADKIIQLRHSQLSELSEGACHTCNAERRILRALRSGPAELPRALAYRRMVTLLTGTLTRVSPVARAAGRPTWNRQLWALIGTFAGHARGSRPATSIPRYFMTTNAGCDCLTPERAHALSAAIAAEGDLAHRIAEMCGLASPDTTARRRHVQSRLTEECRSGNLAVARRIVDICRVTDDEAQQNAWAWSILVRDQPHVLSWLRERFHLA